MSNGYNVWIKNTAIDQNASLAVQPNAIGWRSDDQSEALSHNLTVTFTIWHKWRLYLLSPGVHLSGVTTMPLAWHSTLRLSAINVKDAASNISSLPGVVWSDIHSTSDFISITHTHTDTLHHSSSGWWTMRLETKNDPDRRYYVHFTTTTYCTSRREFRNYLLDPRHVFIVINPLLPWRRKLWLAWYFWLPSDFQGSYNCCERGDPNLYKAIAAPAVAAVVPNEHPPQARQQPRRSPRNR